MNTKEMKMCVETTATTVLTKFTTTITNNISCSSIKLMELKEHCNVAEAFLKECERKIENLNISKVENEKLRQELLQRNKINAVNSESLLQAKNELHKYKCDLKLEYITTERAIKSRKLKCKKILSLYKENWEKTLEKYQALPEAIELSEIQKEVFELEMNIDKFKQLKETTEQQFSKLKENIKKKFSEKVVELSELALFYNSQEFREKLAKQEAEKKGAKSVPSFEFNFFLSKMAALPNASSLLEDQTLNEIPIDVSMFDNLSIPSDHLEIQNEDDLFLFTPSDDDDKMDEKSQSDVMEIDGNIKEENSNELEKSSESNCKDKNVEEESQKGEMECVYFVEKQNKIGRGKISKVQVNTDGYFENFDENAEVVLKNQQVVEGKGDEESQQMINKKKKNVEVDNEDSLSCESYENKQIYNENLECQSSQSSEEISLQSEANCSGNDRSNSPHQPQVEADNTFESKTETKGNSKKFDGFLPKEKEFNSPKPCIFKLF